MYSSHAFRRWASQELKEPGAPLSVAASSWVWRSASFRGYVDLSRDVDLGFDNYLMLIWTRCRNLTETVRRWAFFELGKPIARSATTAFPWVSGFSPAIRKLQVNTIR